MSMSALVKYGKKPEYAAALAAGRDAQMQEAVQSLSACTGAAVETLRKIVDNPSASDINKIAAARALLEFALRFSDSAGSAAVPTVVMIGAHALWRCDRLAGLGGSWKVGFPYRGRGPDFCRPALWRRPLRQQESR